MTTSTALRELSGHRVAKAGIGTAAWLVSGCVATSAVALGVSRGGAVVFLLLAVPMNYILGARIWAARGKARSEDPGRKRGIVENENLSLVFPMVEGMLLAWFVLEKIRAGWTSKNELGTWVNTLFYVVELTIVFLAFWPWKWLSFEKKRERKEGSGTKILAGEISGADIVVAGTVQSRESPRNKDSVE